MDAKKTVQDFFQKNAKVPLPNGDERAWLNCAYLDRGIIDSLGIVMMIAEFESGLGIEFSAEDMQSYDFQTVGGLIALIERKLATGA